MGLLEIFLEKIEKATYNYHKDSRGDDSVRVAICDDEPDFRKRVRMAIDASSSLPQNTEIAEFPDGTSLINSHTEYPYDIIFLDIQMSGISGIEAGHRIRSADRNAIIIFLTSHKQFVFQSFKVEAFDFITKPADDIEVHEVLCRAMKKYREQHYIMQINWQDSSYTLDASEIIYLESSRRHVIFVTRERQYECVGKLNEYEERLLPYGFLRCHHSFIVNMNFIKSIEVTAIRTTTGHDVHMSVRKKQDCLKAFNTYIAKNRI